MRTIFKTPTVEVRENAELVDMVIGIKRRAARAALINSGYRLEKAA